jgi:hypothetical protein
MLTELVEFETRTSTESAVDEIDDGGGMYRMRRGFGHGDGVDFDS